jgi:hypothetical protein
MSVVSFPSHVFLVDYLLFVPITCNDYKYYLRWVCLSGTALIL